MITARALGVRPSRESAVYAVVEVELANGGAAPATVRGYRVVWAGGARRVTAKALVVAPGACVRRTVRVTAADGDLDALLGGAAVHVDELRVSPAAR